jgi:hypothetical protein
MLLYKESKGEIEDRVKRHKLKMLINLVLANTVFIFIIGALVYGEKFHFWDFAYSYLGMTLTPGGFGNTPSFLVYVVGCLFNSFICFKISNTVAVQLYRILFKMCGAGYLLLMLPCNLIDSFHSVGGALVFGSLWFFSVVSINDIYKSGKKYKALFYSLLLNGTVLPYAFMYFVKSPYMQIAQKIALLGLILVLKLITTEQTTEDTLEGD